MFEDPPSSYTIDHEDPDRTGEFDHDAYLRPGVHVYGGYDDDVYDRYDRGFDPHAYTLGDLNQDVSDNQNALIFLAVVVCALVAAAVYVFSAPAIRGQTGYDDPAFRSRTVIVHSPTVTRTRTTRRSFRGSSSASPSSRRSTRSGGFKSGKN